MEKPVTSVIPPSVAGVLVPAVHGNISWQALPPVPVEQPKVQGPTLNFRELGPHPPPHLGPRLGLSASLLC
jgi:hypothetical protein